MKELLKTYAPLVALLIGAGVYFAYGMVAGLQEQNRLLAIQIAEGCKGSLEDQGFVVTAPKTETPETEK